MAAASTSRGVVREGSHYKRPGEGAPAPQIQFLEQQSQRQPRCPDRPARVQVEQMRALQAAEHLGEYNIWYGKYSGERSYEKRGKASTRVVLELDAGLTRADYTNPNACICMHFARGACIKGHECTYRHCAPTEDDETLTDAPHDVFGRSRHGTFKDDMGGTGNWNKECKTLYVGQICCTPSEPVLTESLARHFGEFGVIESVRVLRLKGCGFVTYKLRCAAEFAKEAMADQSLDNDEQLNVRWAYDDPNPRAQAARLRNNAQLMLEAMERKGHVGDADAAAAIDAAYPAEHAHDLTPDDEAEPAAKRQHVGEPATPLTREQAEYQQQLAQWQQAQAAQAEAVRAEHERRQTEMASSISQLDAVLAGIDGTADVPVAAAAEAAEAAEAARAPLVPAPAGEDPLADLYSSIAAASTAGSCCDAAGGTSAAASTATQPQPLDHELPPGVWQSRVPAPWMEYSDPSTGYSYYVNSVTGVSQWARPS